MKKPGQSPDGGPGERGEADFRQLLGKTIKFAAVTAVIVGVGALIWPVYALGVLAGLILGSIDLLGLGLRISYWAKASLRMAGFLVNARFVFRLGLLVIVLYYLGKWGGTGILPWATAGIFVPYGIFALGAWRMGKKKARG